MFNRLLIFLHACTFTAAIAISISSLFFFDQLGGGYTVIAGILFKTSQFYDWGFSIFLILASCLI